MPGQYEIRYSSGQQYLTLARAPITVDCRHRHPDRPRFGGGRRDLQGDVEGPDNLRNFITIVPKGAREGRYSSAYFYTTPQHNPGNLVAPLVPGAYEVRYSTAEKYLTLARRTSP